MQTDLFTNGLASLRTLGAVSFSGSILASCLQEAPGGGVGGTIAQTCSSRRWGRNLIWVTVLHSDYDLLVAKFIFWSKTLGREKSRQKQNYVYNFIKI